ncbi:hypothetical protein GCM10028807_29380 [Spirosoma daeguense]
MPFSLRTVFQSNQRAYLSLLLLLLTIPLQAQVITTIAGSNFNDDGGPATNAFLRLATGVSVDENGNIFISDQTNHLVRKVSPNGIISTIAGNGTAGFSGDGGLATNAQLNNPGELVMDRSGNLYIPDFINHRIRKISPDGIISTIAGNGTAGSSGDGGPAIAAQINGPSSMLVDVDNNLFIVEYYGNRIRKVSSDGIITTLAGNGTAGFSGDGGLATSAQLNSPIAIALDESGNFFVSDRYNQRIRKITSSGIISTVAGTGSAGFNGDGNLAIDTRINYPNDLDFDRNGNLYITDSNNHRIRKMSSDGVISTVAGTGIYDYNGDGGLAINAQLNVPTALATDHNGNLFITDTYNFRVRKVSSDGIISTVAGNGMASFYGDGQPAVNALFYNPSGIAVDLVGNCFIVDGFNHRVRKVDTNGIISTIAGNGVYGYSGDGGAATNAQLGFPHGIAVDRIGNIFIADRQSQRIRKVSSDGIISTIAGNGQFGFNGDGGLAINASLLEPFGVAVDSIGNIFIADRSNARIRKVSTNGIITTVAGNGQTGFNGDGGLAINAQLGFPHDVAVDNKGNLFFNDLANKRIRKVSPAGIISTVAGNGTSGFSGDGDLAINASLNSPSGISVDVHGNLYISDSNNNRIRKVSPEGIISTVVGNGAGGFSGDGGLSTNASLYYPTDVVADQFGNIFITDTKNQRIRKVRGTIVSKQSGDWSAVNTWNCNCIPTAYDTVTISAGQNVTVNEAVQIKGLKQLGNLIFSASGRLSF